MTQDAGPGAGRRLNPFAQLTLRIEKLLLSRARGLREASASFWGPSPQEPDAAPADEVRLRLQALFDSALHGILLANDEGIYVDANPAICQMLRYERHQLVGMSVQQLVAAQEPVDELWQRFIDDRRQVGRVALNCGDGRVLMVDYMATTNIQPGLHLSVLQDASERSRTEATLRAAQHRLVELATEQELRIEALRAEVARDLHDELGQTLGALQLEADRLQALAPGPAQRIRELVREGMSSVRDLSLALRPAALDLGLLAALRALAADTTRRTELDVATDLPPALPSLAAPVELMLFRIAQEALSNAARHAGARRVSLCLQQQPDLLLLEVYDDGSGFDAEAVPGGLGLAGMRERAELIGARFGLLSAPGAGTLVQVQLPLVQKGASR